MSATTADWTDYQAMARHQAQRLAHRLTPAHDIEDLIQVGLVGAWQALASVDPSDPGAGGYVYTAMRHQMIDEVRRGEWLSRRSVTRAAHIKHVHAVFEQREHRAPRARELAAELGWSLATLHAEQDDARIVRTAVYDEVWDDDEAHGPTVPADTRAVFPDGYDAVLGAQEAERLAAAVARLPRRLQTIYRLYCDEPTTLAAMGAALGVTESRACQLLGEMQRRLRARLLSTTVHRRRPWTTAEITELKQRYPHESNNPIARDLARTPSAINQRARVEGLTKTTAYMQAMSGRFASGHTPWNKGTHYDNGATATQFQPGQRPWHTRPIGAMRTNRDGVREQKVTDTGRKTADWKPCHVVLWERHHGPVPAGHVVIFIDRNPTHIRLANLRCVTRAELMAHNSLHRLPKPLERAILQRGWLNRRINELSRQESDPCETR